MPDPLTDRLQRFTPDAAGLDRDGLLFAAGAASVRPRRGWPIVAGVLAATQAATLALWWLSAPPPAPAPLPAAVEEVSSTPLVRETTTPRQRWLDQAMEKPLPAGETGIVPDGPVLRAALSMQRGPIE